MKVALQKPRYNFPIWMAIRTKHRNHNLILLPAELLQGEQPALRNCFINLVCLSACLAQKAGEGKRGERRRRRPVSRKKAAIKEDKKKIRPKDDTDLTAYRGHVMCFKDILMQCQFRSKIAEYLVIASYPFRISAEVHSSILKQRILGYKAERGEKNTTIIN